MFLARLLFFNQKLCITGFSYIGLMEHTMTLLPDFVKSDQVFTMQAFLGLKR